MSNRWVHGALFGCALAVALIGLAHFANVTMDDVFISFRYADNLAAGHGLVFNVGERVEGYSNFSWTVLLAIPIWLHVEQRELGLLITAKVLGLLLSVGTLLVVSRTAALQRSAEQRAFAPIAALYLAALAPFSMWGIGAMETPLVTLLIALTAYRHLREDAALRAGSAPLAWSHVTLLFAALTRPEPVVLFVPLAALRLLRARKFGGTKEFVRSIVQLGLFGLPYAAFLAFRYAYYGQLVPNTYFAKLAHDARAAARGSHYLGAAAEHMNWLWLGLVCGLFILLARRFSYRLVVVSLLTLVQIAALMYEGGDWMPGCRLLVPTLPLIALLVSEAWFAVALISGADLAPRGAAPSWLITPAWLSAWQRLAQTTAVDHSRATLRRALRMTAYAALLSACLASNIGSFDTARMPENLSGLRGLQLDHSNYFRIARWMQRELRDPGLLALGEAGMIPYYTKLPVLDLHGLMDPYVARLPGALHTKFDADYFFRRNPKYVLLLVRPTRDGKLTSEHVYSNALLNDPRFIQTYTPMQDFGVAILYTNSQR